jgi:hypothetical protein
MVLATIGLFAAIGVGGVAVGGVLAVPEPVPGLLGVVALAGGVGSPFGVFGGAVPPGPVVVPPPQAAAVMAMAAEIARKA